MAKLNKSESEQKARTMAEHNTDVKALTLHELDQNFSDYTVRRNHAREYATVALVIVERNEGTRYPNDFVDAYTDHVMNIWGGKLKARETARRNFKSACVGITPQAANQKIMDLLTSMNIRGARVEHSSLAVNRTRPNSWNDDVRLYWSLDRDYDARVDNPDDPTQTAGTYTLNLKVSTSGSSWSLSEMAVINRAQAEVIAAAQELEVVMAQERIIWTRGIPEAPTQELVMSTIGDGNTSPDANGKASEA